jgi:hypothetical protein
MRGTAFLILFAASAAVVGSMIVLGSDGKVCLWHEADQLDGAL